MLNIISFFRTSAPNSPLPISFSHNSFHSCHQKASYFQQQLLTFFFFKCCWMCRTTVEVAWQLVRCIGKRDKVQNEWNWRELYLVSLRDTNALKLYQFELSTLRGNFAISFKIQTSTITRVLLNPLSHLLRHIRVCLYRKDFRIRAFTWVSSLVQQAAIR